MNAPAQDSPLRRARKQLISLGHDLLGAWLIAAIFLVVVSVCASLFYWLTPIGNGLALGQTPLKSLSVYDAFYFSVVTISSLGYGDFQPIGASKGIASGEVILGLVLMGTLVAKLTSSQLSFHVRTLYRTQAQLQLDGYANSFERSLDDFKTSLSALAKAFQSPPSASPSMGERSIDSGVIDKFRSALNTFSGDLCPGFRECLEEGQQGSLLDIVPNSLLVRTLESLSGAAFQFSQILLSLGTEGRSSVLDEHTRGKIDPMLADLKVICRLAYRPDLSDDVKGAVGRLKMSADRIPRNMYAPAPGAFAADQPDLRLSDGEPRP